MRFVLVGFFGVPSLIFLLIYMVGRSRANKRRAWPMAQGSVIASEVVYVRGSSRGAQDRANYRPVIRYRYTVRGEVLEGDTISAAYRHLVVTKGRARRLTKRYAVGTGVRVHYNPTDPLDAVLEPGRGGNLFLLAGIAGLAATVVIGYAVFQDLTAPPSKLPGDTERDPAVESAEEILARLDREAERALKEAEPTAPAGAPGASSPSTEDRALAAARRDVADYLSTGRAIDEPDERSRTRLHVAAKAGDQELVRELLAAGSNPTVADSGHKTALHLAATQGWDEVVRMLLEAGADPAARDLDGNTAADLAGLNGHARLQLRMRSFERARGTQVP